MTESQLVDLIQRELGGLSTKFDDNNYADALDEAERETGFSAEGNSNSFQITWLKSRTKRHLFFQMLSESAHKFKFKQVNLQHRFDHYMRLISKLDGDFKIAIEENAHEFAQVSVIHLFGHKADAGFSYDHMGNDTTYDDDQAVVVEPADVD